MLNLLTVLVETAIKTVTLPVTIAADIITLGGVLSDKGGQTYPGDMMDSLNRSIEK
jgi:hypothetical protein